MSDIIQEVLQREEDAAADIERTEQELKKRLEDERIAAQQAAEAKIEATRKRYAEERTDFQNQLDARSGKEHKRIEKKLKKYDKITEKHIDDVARQVLKALK